MNKKIDTILPEGTKISVSVTGSTIIGEICGYTFSLPGTGMLYIIKIKERIGAVANIDYPYSCTLIPETLIKVIPD